MTMPYAVLRTPYGVRRDYFMEAFSRVDNAPTSQETCNQKLPFGPPLQPHCRFGHITNTHGNG